MSELRYASTKIVSEASRKASPIDELQRAEEKMLAELAMKVHHDRREWMSWPQIKRLAMKWTNDIVGQKLRELTQPERDFGIRPDEWHIRVSVLTVPK
jgi:hypothetical protein